MRAASAGTDVAEAQHIQGAATLRHRRQTRRVVPPLVAIEGVEEAAVQHRVEHAPQLTELQRVGHRELGIDSRSSAFARAIANAVSATSTPRTCNPNEAT